MKVLTRPNGLCGASIAGAFLCAAFPALAQPAEQGLDQAASDPTAPLMNLQLQTSYSPSFYNLSGADQTILQFRSAIPFRTGALQHIFRITAPYWVDGANGSDGVSDTTIFDLVTFDQSWGRWGVGAVALLPTGGSRTGAEKWGLGPAVGFTVARPGLLWGLFNQNILTVAGEDDREDVNVSVLQPILSKSLGGGWSVGNSEMTATYDWDRHDWTSLPLGVKVSRLFRPADGPPTQLSLQYEHNFADDHVVAEDTWSISVKVLLPR